MNILGWVVLCAIAYVVVLNFLVDTAIARDWEPTGSNVALVAAWPLFPLLWPTLAAGRRCVRLYKRVRDRRKT